MTTEISGFSVGMGFVTIEEAMARRADAARSWKSISPSLRGAARRSRRTKLRQPAVDCGRGAATNQHRARVELPRVLADVGIGDHEHDHLRLLARFDLADERSGSEVLVVISD